MFDAAPVFEWLAKQGLMAQLPVLVLTVFGLVSLLRKLARAFGPFGSMLPPQVPQLVIEPAPVLFPQRELTFLDSAHHYGVYRSWSMSGYCYGVRLDAIEVPDHNRVGHWLLVGATRAEAAALLAENGTPGALPEPPEVVGDRYDIVEFKNSRRLSS